MLIQTFLLKRPDGDHKSYITFINALPAIDPPEAFGQHPNANISSMIREAKGLLGTLVSLQPAVSASLGASSEDKVMAQAADMLARLPAVIDEETTTKMCVGKSSLIFFFLFRLQGLTSRFSPFPLGWLTTVIHSMSFCCKKLRATTSCSALFAPR